MMSKPIRTLILLSIVFALCLGLMAIFPKDGIRVTEGFVLDFPDWESFWSREEGERRVALEELFDIYNVKVDSTAIRDSMEKRRILYQQEMKRLQFPYGDKSILDPLTKALKDVRSSGKTMRILHYGDSQIEGDRITAYLRSSLQKEYGGSGPGWISLTEIVPSLSINYKFSEEWERYTVYGRSASKVHKKYGILGTFSRFTPEKEIVDADSMLVENDEELIPLEEIEIRKSTPAGDTITAWCEISPSKMGYSGVRRFKKVRLAYGNATTPVKYRVFNGETLVEEGQLPLVDLYNELIFTFEETPQKLRFEFTGVESPDFYGISLESHTGVLVDNIAMRGSSGTVFNKMDSRLLSAQFGRESVGLIILQYGGNSVPYIKSEKQAEDYGKWFQSQIRTLKRLNPNAAVIVIGPSDMSIKEKDKFVTYPYLDKVRDALKNAAFEQGAAYWDMYEAMGGKGSMPSWVNADPPLASTDHIHFAPAGSKLVAEWFYEAIQEALKEEL